MVEGNWKEMKHTVASESIQSPSLSAHFFVSRRLMGNMEVQFNLNLPHNKVCKHGSGLNNCINRNDCHQAPTVQQMDERQSSHMGSYSQTCSP